LGKGLKIREEADNISERILFTRIVFGKDDISEELGKSGRYN
jgi:hypothetical protein